MTAGSSSRSGKTNRPKKTCKPFSSSVRRGNKFIKITPTGWANIKNYISVVEGEYIVPYSSHSNFEEIDLFVNSLRPAILKCVVRENRSHFQKLGNVKQFNSYMFTLQSLKQTGYDMLVKKYTDVTSLSPEYLNMMNPGVSNEINEKLGLKITEAKKFEEDTRRFDQSFSQVLKAKNTKKLNKGVRIKDPEENEELTKDDIEFLKDAQANANASLWDDADLNKPLKKPKPSEVHLIELHKEDGAEEIGEKKTEGVPAKRLEPDGFFDDEFK